MTEEVTIRPCTEADLQELISIGKQTFIETFAHLNDPKYFDPYVTKAFTEAQILAELKNPDSQFSFLYDRGTLSGYLKLNFNEAQTDIKDPESMEIERIYLLSPFQGLGLGRALFAHSLATARQHNIKYIWLGVWEQNTKAIAFYEAQGFYKFANHPFKLGDDQQTDYLMRLDLSWKCQKMDLSEYGLSNNTVWKPTLLNWLKP